MREREILMNLYNRTLSNCTYYNSKGMKNSLLNEIGVLRGILYCIEGILEEDISNPIFYNDKFVELIKFQQSMKEADEE